MTITRVILAAVLGMGLLETALAAADTHYVAQAGQTPESPYTNGWASAASNIQAAVDESAPGDTVLVSNGVYATGGIPISGKILTNRVAITKIITVCSANNDPTNTIIKGAWHSLTNKYGPSAVRCVYLADYAKLIGFTLTNGATLAESDASGGGVLSVPRSHAIISNCIVTGNAASGKGGGGGGGAHLGILYNCQLIGNVVDDSGNGNYPNGAGALSCTLYNCTIASNRNTRYEGGGVRLCTLYNCTLIGNVTSSKGGGAREGTLYNCMLIGNVAGTGGGAEESTLYNCTVIGNIAGTGGGVNLSKSVNSIVYFNSGNGITSNYSGTVFTNSCTAPTPATAWAAGNITNDPIFIDSGSGYGTNHAAGNYRLSPVSPCINAGTNQNWMTNSYDLDGRPRVKYSRVDMGCYELILKGSVLSFR